MKITPILVAVILLSFVSSSISYAQKSVVTISLANKKVEGDIPFDEEFVIKGPVDKDVLSVSFKYDVKAGRTNYWPLNPETVWKRDGGDEYYFECGRLHPNVTYAFSFKVRKKISIEDAAKTDIKRALIAKLKQFFARQMTSSEINGLRTDLTMIIKDKLNLPGTLVDAAGNVFVVGPFTDPLKAPADRINALVSQIATDSTNNETTARNFTLRNSAGQVTPINNLLFSVYNGATKLGSPAVALLKESLDPSNKDFAALDGNDFLEFYVRNLINANNMKKLLDGSVQIEGKKLVPSEKRHLPSLMILNSFINTLQSRFFTLEQTPAQIKARSTPVHVFNNTHLTNLSTIQSELELYIKNDRAITRNKETLNNQINQFPDLLVNVFQEQQFEIQEHPTIDITSDKNPYVGIDIGFVWAPFINEFFTYQGLNMYLVPVNKNTPLNVYQKKDKFLKKFSIYLGVTQNVTNSNYTRYENLISGTGSILVGCGWRFTRGLRGNIGGMFYNQKNRNPVIDDSAISVAPTASLSLDINISKAFGDLSKVFKFQ